MHPLRSRAVLLVALSLTAGRSARAEDAPPVADPADRAGRPAEGAKPPEGKAAVPALRVLTDAEAAPILDGLKRAAKAKAIADAAPALDALAGVNHHDFEPALARLLTHASPEVAARAARALGERASDGTAATLWKAWSSPVNEKRPDVRAAILDALAAMKAPLDPKQYVQVERTFADAASAVAMEAVARYFVAVPADRRPCKVFALWLDEPSPASVHDGANPPKEWWEARWTLWQRTRPAVVEALKAITGQEFASSEQAKAWFAANRAFGVRW